MYANPHFTDILSPSPPAHAAFHQREPKNKRKKVNLHCFEKTKTKNLKLLRLLRQHAVTPRRTHPAFGPVRVREGERVVWLGTIKFRISTNDKASLSMRLSSKSRCCSV